MQTYAFRPNYQVIGQVRPVQPAEDINGEVTMYGASARSVRLHGGRLSREILDAIPDWYFLRAEALGLAIAFDIAVREAQAGGYLQHPGWKRSRTPESCEDEDHPGIAAHIVCTISSAPGIAAELEFLDEELTVAIHPLGGEDALAGRVNTRLKELGARRALSTRLLRLGELIAFDQLTLRRTGPSRTGCSRLQFRARYEAFPENAGSLLCA